MYKCTTSFTTNKGKSYSYGDKIYSSDYDSLEYSEKRNFQEESETSYSSNLSSYMDYSSNSSSDSSSSSGIEFGGGSFSGGGSGGEW